MVSGASRDISAPVRLATLAIGLAIGFGADIKFFDGLSESPAWRMLEWTSVAVPLLLVLALRRAPLPGWQWPPFELHGRPRVSTVVWLLCSIVLPWMLAWLMADAVGQCSMSWWARANLDREPFALRLAIYAVVWAVIYATASIVGLFITLLVDRVAAGSLVSAGTQRESARRQRDPQGL